MLLSHYDYGGPFFPINSIFALCILTPHSSYRTLIAHETFYNYKLPLFASKNVNCLKALLATISILRQSSYG